jgi:hypothetical protein
LAAHDIAHFNEEADGIMKFPIQATEIAFKCPEYESQIDILKRADVNGV